MFNRYEQNQSLMYQSLSILLKEHFIDLQGKGKTESHTKPEREKKNKLTTSPYSTKTLEPVCSNCPSLRLLRSPSDAHQ